MKSDNISVILFQNKRNVPSKQYFLLLFVTHANLFFRCKLFLQNPTPSFFLTFVRLAAAPRFDWFQFRSNLGRSIVTPPSFGTCLGAPWEKIKCHSKFMTRRAPPPRRIARALWRKQSWWVKGVVGRGNKLIRYFCDVTVFDGEKCFFCRVAWEELFFWLRYYFLLVWQLLPTVVLMS